MKGSTFWSEEVMKRKLTSHPKLEMKWNQEEASLWHAVSLWLCLPERCVSLGSHSPFREHSLPRAAPGTNKAMTDVGLTDHMATPHGKQKLLGFTAPASVQPPCPARIQSQPLSAVTGVLQLAPLLLGTCQTGQVLRVANRVTCELSCTALQNYNKEQTSAAQHTIVWRCWLSPRDTSQFPLMKANSWQQSPCRKSLPWTNSSYSFHVSHGNF